MRRMGLGLLTPRAGLAALDAVLAGPAASGGHVRAAAVVAAVPIRWERLLQTVGPRSELFAEFSTLQVPLGSATPTAIGDSAHAPARHRQEFEVRNVVRVIFGVKLMMRIRHSPVTDKPTNPNKCSLQDTTDPGHTGSNQTVVAGARMYCVLAQQVLR